jgi:hypothetical protein
MDKTPRNFKEKKLQTNELTAPYYVNSRNGDKLIRRFLIYILEGAWSDVLKRLVAACEGMKDVTLVLVPLDEWVEIEGQKTKEK